MIHKIGRWLGFRKQETRLHNEDVAGLSIIVIVYKMPRQAKNTLLSLSKKMQVLADESKYEVIVVENQSSSIMGPGGLPSNNANFKYFYRIEPSPSPAPAINFGVRQSRFSHVAIMIDGARMVSPGIIKNMQDIFHADASAVITVPGYHLGKKLQQQAIYDGYNEKTELKLLENIGWPKQNPYRLFEISCFSGSCKPGFFQPHAESNLIAMKKDLYDSLGGYDERFDLPGGGDCNLDFYKRACELKNSPLYLLWGEGSFHQFHGGVTTGQKSEIRLPLKEKFKEQYFELKGYYHSAPEKVPILYGQLNQSVIPFINESLDRTE